MANRLSLVRLTNADRQFYPLLGPFLARRDVVKAVGGPIWDEDTKTWLVLRDGKTVMGFVAVATRGNRTIVESLYVADPTWARVASELVGAAVQAFGAQPLHATVIRDRAPAFTAAGFRLAGETNGFVKLYREGS